MYKVVCNYPQTSNYVPDCYKTQKMCIKDVNTHAFKIQFVPECNKTHKMFDKAVSRSFLCFFYS